MTTKSVAILSVATNKYVDYWADMVKSIDRVFVNTRTEIVAHVLTEQVDVAEQISKDLKKIKVVVHKIPAYTWPEATLFRYRLFDEIKASIKEDLVMHLDADMLVLEDFLSVLPNKFYKDIALVIHPGFYRPHGLKRVKFYILNPNYLIHDVTSSIKQGGIGAWETSMGSQSFVPRSDRKNYVCGGTWFGYKDAFFKMIGELSQLERADTDNGVTPKWHDESLLNFWLTHNKVTLLPPSFCFYPQYPQLKGLPEFIRAVDKNAK